MQPTDNTISWLTNTPASDVNFKSALQGATPEQIREALARTRGKPNNTTRTKILERKLRKLQRGNR